MVMKSLLVLYSYHHNNTEEIAKVFARVLDAQIKTPQQVNLEELQAYSLIGLGSGIYGGKHLNICLALPIDYHRSPTRKHSFSQPVELQEKPKSPKIIRCSGKNCNPKVT
jgi:menaquinone-dependent protoporphyrinogen IX oxidase